MTREDALRAEIDKVCIRSPWCKGSDQHDQDCPAEELAARLSGWETCRGSGVPVSRGDTVICGECLREYRVVNQRAPWHYKHLR